MRVLAVLESRGGSRGQMSRGGFGWCKVTIPRTRRLRAGHVRNSRDRTSGPTPKPAELQHSVTDVALSTIDVALKMLPGTRITQTLTLTFNAGWSILYNQEG